jgi:hypothetical protein
MNPQLISYIRQARLQKTTDEEIKKNLLSAGWTEQDIASAISTIDAPASIPISSMPSSPVASVSTSDSASSSVSVSPAPVLKTFESTPVANQIPLDTMRSSLFPNRVILPQTPAPQSHILKYIIIFVFISVGGYYTYINYFQPASDIPEISDLNTSVDLFANQVTQNTPPTAPISDMDKVKIALEDIKNAYLMNNFSLLEKHSSVETLKTLNASTLINPVTIFNYNNLSIIGDNILANIESDLSTLNGPMVFIKENNEWKFDLIATTKYADEQNELKKGKGDPNGLPDLVVTGLKISPDYLLVNNKDIKITVSIKNIGTKTSDNGAPLVATLLGFNKMTPAQGGVFTAMAPGETLTWDFYPYKSNEFFKISDIAGQKNVQIVLNKDKKIKESKYDNNTFTQTILMYDK